MINRIDTKSVKIIRLVSGEEICCKFPLHKNQLPENSKLLRLQEPMLIKYVPRITEQGISDYIALVRWVGFTDEKIVTIPIDKIVTICNATPAFTKRYDGLTKTLKNSKQALPGFIERNMTDDELDQFADSDPYERDIDKIVTICNATPAFTKRYDGLTKTLKNSKQALPGFIERNMTDEELDEMSDSDPYERDIDKRDIKEVADLLKMPSKKIH